MALVPRFTMTPSHEMVPQVVFVWGVVGRSVAVTVSLLSSELLPPVA